MRCIRGFSVFGLGQSCICVCRGAQEFAEFVIVNHFIRIKASTQITKIQSKKTQQGEKKAFSGPKITKKIKESKPAFYVNIAGHKANRQQNGSSKQLEWSCILLQQRRQHLQSQFECSTEAGDKNT